MAEDNQSDSEVKRRKPDWPLLESAITEPKDIVDHISEATGYFHPSEAEKLRDIASHSGTKPIGIVRSAVEKEIEDLEWRCVHFEYEGREYIQRNPYEYYQIHEEIRQQYRKAISELCDEDALDREIPKEGLEEIVDELEDRARVHRAKAQRAEDYLESNDIEPPEVNVLAE